MGDLDGDAPPGVKKLVDDVNKLKVESKPDAGSSTEVLPGPPPIVGTMDEPDKDKALNSKSGEVQTKSADGAIYTSAKRFEDLGLTQELLDGIYLEMKFETPSKIQATTLPMILTPPYQNLIAQAHNGSGKTTCFVLAMLQRVDPKIAAPQAVLVCPTRELISQNLDIIKKMGTHCNIGVSTTLQDIPQLKQNLIESGKRYIEDAIVVGAHGRLKSYISKKLLPINNIKLLVLDEADEMLDQQGFRGDSERLIKDIQRATNNTTQILLFSATFNDQIRDYAERVVPGANQVYVPKEQLSLDVIKQYRVVVPDEDSKFKVLNEIIFPNCDKLGQTIVFCRTRENVRFLHKQLIDAGHTVSAVSGAMEAQERDRVTSEFRKGVTRILIATNVLSRGFDVQEVTLVINYDIPTTRDGWKPDFDTYLHRIGRSGRFGRKGAAFNLAVGYKDVILIDEIQKYFQKDIAEVSLKDEAAFVDVLKEAGLSSGDFEL